MHDRLVLCYHAVSPTWPADLSVTPANFERQLQILLGRGYRPVTFTEAVQSPTASRVVAITFDDGFASVHANAWPILRRLGVAVLKKLSATSSQRLARKHRPAVFFLADC